MILCKKCGKELEDDSKFCNNCGTAIINETEERKIVYEGNIHKCPNCGEALKAFDVKCPSCGFEIRDRNSSSSLREFYLKLEKIESGREKKKATSIFAQSLTGDNLSKTDEQKISLIRSFIIPNTKEDLYEFLILSKSNIEIDLYENTQLKTARLAVSDAWKAKFEQAYEKAKLLFKNDERMFEIHGMYDEVNKSIDKAKWKTWKITGIVFGIVFGALIIICIVIFALIGLTGAFDSENSNKENNEDKSSIIENIDKQDSKLNINDNTLENNEFSSVSLNEKDIIEKLKTTQYKYIEYGKTFTVFIISNQSENTLRININFKFYDKNGNLIGAKDRNSNAVEKGTDTIMYMITDDDYDKLEYDISVEKDDYYAPIISSLKYTNTKATNKEILTLTNNSDFTGQAIEAYAIFFKDDKMVECVHEYMSDNNGVLESKKSLTKEFYCDKEYDDVKFYFTGYGK